MTDYGKLAYWRWKKTKGAWYKVRIKRIGNGLVEVRSDTENWSSPSTLSESEIQIKWWEEGGAQKEEGAR